MANPAERWEDNVPGTWFVDKSCILCSLCVDLAPNNFKESEAGDHDMVFKQPASDEEAAQCKEAMEQCPVEAIGSNG
jgi:ferredoxin